MLNKNMRKNEVESFLNGKGDFVKIDHLNRYLKQIPPLEMRKFAYLKLAEIYEEKRMFFDAAKSYKNIVINSLTKQDKITFTIKEAESYIKAGEFMEADKSFKRALSEASSSQKLEIYKNIKRFYKSHAESLEKNFKTNHASKIYERMLTMNLSEVEEKEIREKLLKLYEKLGKMKEIKFLRGL